MATRGSPVHISMPMAEFYGRHPDNVSFMQFSTIMYGFEQKIHRALRTYTHEGIIQLFKVTSSHIEQYSLETLLWLPPFTKMQNYTLALTFFFKPQLSFFFFKFQVLLFIVKTILEFGSFFWNHDAKKKKEASRGVKAQVMRRRHAPLWPHEADSPPHEAESAPCLDLRLSPRPRARPRGSPPQAQAQYSQEWVSRTDLHFDFALPLPLASFGFAFALALPLQPQNSKGII